MAKGRRNKNRTESNMTNSSPNDRARKRGKKQQQSFEDEEMQDGSIAKRLFPDNTSSEKANPSNTNNNESDNDNFSLSTKEDSDAEVLSQPSVNPENQEQTNQKTDTDNNNNNNNNTKFNKLENYDLASAPPPKMWTLPIASPNDFWTSLDPELYTLISHPLILKSLATRTALNQER